MTGPNDVSLLDNLSAEEGGFGTEEELRLQQQRMMFLMNQQAAANATVQPVMGVPIPVGMPQAQPATQPMMMMPRMYYQPHAVEATGTVRASPSPTSMEVDRKSAVLLQCMRCIGLGAVSNLSALVTPDVVLRTPTLPSDCPVPYAGTYCGIAGITSFTDKAHQAWKGGLKSFNLHGTAVNGDLGYAMLNIEVECENGNIYKEEEPVTVRFVGDKVSQLSIHVNTPAACAAFGGKNRSGKPLNLKCPCPHNSWDNVRAKKGGATLRCRICQVQWKTSLSDLTRCTAFMKGQCTLEKNCPNIHVHGKKQSLTERVDKFGNDVLVRVPRHVAQQATAEDCPPDLSDSPISTPSTEELMHDLSCLREEFAIDA
eukprot:TRINITY_DN5099_c0_g1_i1.p1 TRINITY_DN5099_c0_g1~~TRINITY_DN5099_c0_g1_i1.p1  ORF type:complete len:370 (+),score=71.79 TRINITY_DN5099_c0_g1_i1:61-1170(+)